MAKTVKKYPKLTIEAYEGTKDSPAMTVEKMMELLHWESEPEGGNWGNDFDFRDVNKVKVRLGNNAKNRPYRPGLMLTYMKKILNKDWKLNGETFIFDWFGMGVSGQHRGIAFINAELERRNDPAKYPAWGKKAIELPCIVVMGTEPETADTVDLGQNRTGGDIFFRRREFTGVSKADQKKYSNDLAVAVRLFFIRSEGSGKVANTGKLLHEEMLRISEAHPRLAEMVQYVRGLDGLEKYSPSMGYAAALIYLMATSKTTDKADLNFAMESKAKDFWTMLATGEGKDFKLGHAVYALREYLNTVNADPHKKLSRDFKVGIIVKAWNHFVDGTPLYPALKKGVSKKAAFVELLTESQETENEDGEKTTKTVVIEFPTMGGLDGAKDVEPDWEVGIWAYAPYGKDKVYTLVRIEEVKGDKAKVLPDPEKYPDGKVYSVAKADLLGDDPGADAGEAEEGEEAGE